MKKPEIVAADLFCGAGGASNGLRLAADELGRKVRLVAVNHWRVAVETHSRNHPEALHLCEDVGSVNPRKAVPGGRLDLLLAGPECTHHSTARGGKPINDQSRASAWCILRWATALDIDMILIENVKEFQTWGPLGHNGRPLRSRKGETFQAFLQSLKSLGYKVDWRVFNAADYGDPTTRERLFVQAVRGRRQIRWPAPTHSRDGQPSLFGPTDRWRPAREIIDWSVPAPSIFGRKRPLSPNTLARIAAGLRKFGGAAAEPFLVLLNGGGRAGAGGVKSVDGPVPVVTAGGEHIALCRPFIVPTNYGERPGQTPRCHSLDSPMPTVVGSVTHALVEPFVIPVTHSDKSDRSKSINGPLPTLTGSRELGLMQPFLMSMSQSGSNGDRVRPVDAPLPTITTADDLAVCEPFLVKFNGTARGRAYEVGEPLDTVTGKDRFGLVETARLDIGFRMLTPLELARAHSFDDDYYFHGNREQKVKQIGNSWPNRLGRALVLAMLAPH